MGFWVAFFIQLAIAVVLTVIAYALTPKPPTAKPPEARDQDNPTADAGRPIPVVFGTLTVKGLNVVHPGADKNKQTYKVTA